MKYFIEDGRVYAFAQDGSQDAFITKGMKKMTSTQVERHLNYDKFLSNEERYAIYIKSLQPLTRRQFMLTLVHHELDELLEYEIANIDDNKKRKIINVEYKDSQSYERLSSSTLFMFELLNINEEAANELWEYGLKL